MNQPQYTTSLRLPTFAEYKSIFEAVGWADYLNLDVVEQSLKQSLFGVVIQHGDETIGMGRVVGDGMIYFYIQDIAVVPAHQNQGIGRQIMDVITDYLKHHAPEKAFIGLFASQGKEPFYNRYGFNRHDGMTGMFGVIHEGEIK
ncbi:acetyltransferase (GNAT) family protein [Paenibacillus cellulosilyticus]|uniref:Acetyltransferase (GNAT) family protein n=1 Tax=Paenibacillus cellulosilyticus TaxID=375489 RepID=A0A2V2YMP8_9BACL|nr:GNAT family N-acetyltransferase [Paenibacillus cellulosilyticus]PWV94503.1 acetyltransferase (GNAT) family protein [Paenibacillus cellulosilyticus]QKS45012.1 GNAT family N-acetyltransferase [Paenibacillus cellulosilyticus]